MYTVIINKAKTLVFGTKEALIQHFVKQESTFGVDPKTYIPHVFTDIALNENDIRTLNPYNEYFHRWFMPEPEARTTMVYDTDGRIIDIRLWLPEFRAAMEKRINTVSERSWNKSENMGSRPKFRKCYRRPKGLKQRKSLSEQIDREEILEVMSSVPAGLLREYKDDEYCGQRRSYTSWKRQSKCRKSWQRRTDEPSARQLYKQDWLGNIEDIETETMPMEDDWIDLEPLFPMYESDLADKIGENFPFMPKLTA